MHQRSRLAAGVDVPWVTSWSAETISGARPCRAVDGQLAVFQTERPGWGKPNYSENHFRRQRQSVAGMLCPMCGGATTQSDRWSLTAKLVAAGVLRAKHLGHLLPTDLADAQVVLNAGSIAPLHRACAERSAWECPHLKADAAVTLHRFPARWAVAPLWVQTGWAAPEQILLARTPDSIPVVGFLQLIGITDEVDPKWRRAVRKTVSG